MSRLVTLVLLYARRSFLEWAGFRSFLVTLVVNQAVAPLLGLAIWSAAMPQRADIPAYFIAVLVAQLATVSQEYYSVTLHIYEGHLADDLVRPHPVVISPLGASIAFRLWNLLVGVPVVIAATVIAGVPFALADVCLALPALLLAMALRFLFEYTLALSALWIQQASAVGEVGSTLTFLLGGVAVPIFLFPERIRPLAEALPFRAMLGFPAELMSGALERQQILAGFAWQGIWLAVMTLAAMLVWQSGVRRYTAVGG